MKKCGVTTLDFGLGNVLVLRRLSQITLNFHTGTIGEFTTIKI